MMLASNRNIGQQILSRFRRSFHQIVVSFPIHGEHKNVFFKIDLNISLSLSCGNRNFRHKKLSSIVTFHVFFVCKNIRIFFERTPYTPCKQNDHQSHIECLLNQTLKNCERIKIRSSKKIGKIKMRFVVQSSARVIVWYNLKL